MAYLFRVVALLFFSLPAYASISSGLAWSGTASKCSGGTQSVGPVSSCSDYGHQILIASKGTCTDAQITFTWLSSSVSGAVCTTNFTGSGTSYGGGTTFNSTGTYVCPANSVVAGGSCNCISGYQENSAHTACQAACPAPGTYMQMAVVNALSLTQAQTLAAPYNCNANNCGMKVTGLSSNGISQAVLSNGTPLIQFTGSVISTGQTCGAPATPLPTTPPAQTCASGQFLATVNGVTKCFDNASGAVTASSDQPVAQCTTTTDNATVTNGDGSHTVTSTATDNCTGKVTVNTVTYPSTVTPPAVPSTVTTTNNNSSFTNVTVEGLTGQAGTPTYITQANPGQDMSAFCETHPDSNACRSASAGSDMEAYCANNPNDGACKEATPSSGHDNGCPAEPTCSSVDDPVECLAVYQQWNIRCELHNALNDAHYTGLTDPNNPVGTTAQQSAAATALAGTSTNLADTFQAARSNYLTVTSACANSFSFVFRGVTFNVDLSFICTMNQFIKLLVHMFAYMVVIRMLMNFSTGKAA